MEYNAAKFREVMKTAKITSYRLAQDVGCSKTAISLLKHDKYPATNSRLLRKIVDYYKKMGIENAEDILNPETPEQGKKTIQEVTKVITVNILKEFGLKDNPFSAEIPSPKKVWVNNEIQNVEEAIVDSAMNQGFLLVVGEVGTGKSTILKKSLRRLEREDRVKVCLPSKYFVEKITSGFLADAMIQDFGGQDPARTYRQRAAQIRDVIEKNYNDNIKQVLIIDEAQGLHPNTLRALKRFWEGIGGSSSLLSVILMGQPFIYGTLSAGNLAEVKLRLSIIELDPFASRNGNMISYIQHKLKLAGGSESLFTEKAVVAISKRARTPLQVNVLCKNALIEASRLKETVISDEVVENV